MSMEHITRLAAHTAAAAVMSHVMTEDVHGHTAKERLHHHHHGHHHHHHTSTGAGAGAGAGTGIDTGTGTGHRGKGAHMHDSLEEIVRHGCAHLDARIPTKTLDTLVFGGGGLKGWVYIGILEEMATRGMPLRSLAKRFVGTSIGALFAFFVVLGCCQADVEAVFRTASSPKFDLGMLLSRHGLSDMGELRQALRHLAERKINMKNPTMAELQKATGCDLQCVHTEIREAQAVYVAASTHPYVFAIEAVIDSMRIPVLFTPGVDAVHRPSMRHAPNQSYAHGRHHAMPKPHHVREGVRYDGGLIETFPMSRCTDPSRMLGFRFVWSRAKHLDSMPSRVWRAMHISMSATDGARWGPLMAKFASRVVTLDVDFISTTDMTVTDAQHKRALHMGRCVAQNLWTRLQADALLSSQLASTPTPTSAPAPVPPPPVPAPPVPHSIIILPCSTVPHGQMCHSPSMRFSITMERLGFKPGDGMCIVESISILPLSLGKPKEGDSTDAGIDDATLDGPHHGFVRHSASHIQLQHTLMQHEHLRCFVTLTTTGTLPNDARTWRKTHCFMIQFRRVSPLSSEIVGATDVVTDTKADTKVKSKVDPKVKSKVDTK